MQDLDALVKDALAAFASTGDADALEQTKARYLGKTGLLTEQLKGLGKLPPAEKPAMGARINAAKSAIEQALADLFGAFMADPSRLPEEWAAECGKPDDAKTARAVCDYIAGMTDRFALQEYKRIFLVEFPL